MSASENAARAERERPALAPPPAALPESETRTIRGDSLAEIRRLSSLLDISKALSGTLHLQAALHHVIEILMRNPDARHTAVALLEDDGTLRMAESDDINRPTASREMSAEIVDRVVDTSRRVVIPRVGGDTLESKRRADALRLPVSFICVPIVINRKAVGALSVDLVYRADRDFERAGTFYGLVASMLAQALKIHRLIEEDRRRLEDENSHLRQELRERYDFSNIIGTSAAVRSMYAQIAQVASTNTTVLIRGESGTGKELIAHAIHYNSLRAKKPFIKVSCAALPDTLIESELFGHERGAFTDATVLKKGRFELAEGGTLFLDEIGDVNLSTQIRLLRVLQQREFERLGGIETLKANVRIVAATNKNLEQAIASGDFREDLYYRLNVFTIFVPPLRERKADLPLLVDHFLEKLSRDHHKTIRRVSTPAIDALMSYHWPGNVRELENVLERALLVCDGEALHAHHLPPTLQTAETSGEVVQLSLKDAVERYERDLIRDALKTSRGNRAKAARLLGTTERILYRRVNQLGIDFRRFRA
ncbi:MAG TPA: sigma 54-interacting transcriptional regulator [Vicinamibacterales bacterium]|nr:sigma 54-interacting transcriptional regulator [Vicinamibacterales bacterium]